MRLFIAIELNETIKAELTRLQSRLAKHHSAVRPTRPEQMHITLKFLGDVAEDKLPAVRAVFESAAQSQPVFRLTLDQAGCFPPRGKVRVIWVGAQDNAETMQALALSYAESFEPLGFAREARSFTPHITLARSRKAGLPQEMRAVVSALQPQPLEQEINSVALIQSVLGPAGPQYSTLARAALNQQA